MKDIAIRVKEINEISFYLKPLPMPIEQIQFGENLIFGLGFSFNVDIEKELFSFNTLVKYQVKGIEEPVVELENEIVFEIQNLAEVVTTDGEGMDIKDDFLITLAGVAVGTTRGILAANAKGSHWANFPLPILNPKELIEDMNPDS
jgi:hypothetical protein